MKITAYVDAEDWGADPEHQSGLSVKGHRKLLDSLQRAGLSDVEFDAEPESEPKAPVNLPTHHGEDPVPPHWEGL